MLLEKEDYEKRIKSLSDKVGMDDESLEMLGELKSDYDDRNTLIAEKDEIINASDGISFKDKYYDLCEKYKDRFFNTNTSASEIKAGNQKDMETENDNRGGDLLSYESLFKERGVN